MIHFFRRIRQKLLINSQFKKYTLYAVGEIILVIIGILIALFINDWRNEKQLHNREYETLMALYSEFKETKTQIELYINGNEEIIETAKTFITFCFKSDKSINSATFDSLLYHTAWHYSLNINQGVLNELFNTGKLSIIKDQSTRVLLSNWTATLSHAESINSHGAEYLTTMMVELLDKKVAWAEMIKYDRVNPLTLYEKKRNIDRNLLAKDLRIENFAINQIWFCGTQVESAQALLDLNNQILNQISSSTNIPLH